jgi:Ala-tRNA(Pro) deacylase
MILRKLTEFLDKNGVKYVVMTHSPAFRASEIAATAHIPGRELAKTVMVKADGKMTMAVLPASTMVDFRLLKKALSATKVELATETEFKGLFPDCEVGAMPPFGNLFDIDVLASQSLQEDEEIAFNAGSHRELVKMGYKDFERLVKPKLLTFSVKKKTHEGDEIIDEV